MMELQSAMVGLVHVVYAIFLAITLPGYLLEFLEVVARSKCEFQAGA